jgi:hypothetical protein
MFQELKPTNIYKEEYQEASVSGRMTGITVCIQSVGDYFKMGYI